MQAKLLQAILFLTAFTLVFYTIGAALFEGHVNYPTWYLIGEAEFRAYHQEIGRRIIPILVVPLLAAFILTILLLWLRPLALPRWNVGLSIMLQLVVIVVTVTISLPIQMQLSQQGVSSELLDRLIATSWLRDVPGLFNGALYFWMMYQMTTRGKSRS
jgi:hypothetical protein